LIEIHDEAGFLVVNNFAIYSDPKLLHLNKNAKVKFHILNDFQVLVESDGLVLWVMLTTIVDGVFSENAFIISGNEMKVTSLG